MFVVGWAERTAAVCRIQAYQLELSVFGTEITAPQALSEGSFPFVNSLISRRLSAESLMMMSNSNFQSHKLWIIDRMQPRRTTAIPEGRPTGRTQQKCSGAGQWAVVIHRVLLSERGLARYHVNTVDTSLARCK